jgi:hypothetical protein
VSIIVAERTQNAAPGKNETRSGAEERPSKKADCYGEQEIRPFALFFMVREYK